jgi:hypothetical protein
MSWELLAVVGAVVVWAIARRFGLFGMGGS